MDYGRPELADRLLDCIAASIGVAHIGFDQ